MNIILTGKPLSQPQLRLPSRLIHNYPSGFAWAAQDDRVGRYVMCPYKPDEPMQLGVVNDFGDLVQVPCDHVELGTPNPATGLLA